MKRLKPFLIALFLFSAVKTFATGGPKNGISIEINIAFSSEGHWTKNEILKRFEYMRSIYQRACEREINLILGELVEINDPELQNFNDYLTVTHINQIKAILGLFKVERRPTLFYMQQSVVSKGGPLTDIHAQAYTFDGPRVFKSHEHIWNEPVIASNPKYMWAEGNLDWERFNELKPVYGTAVISQYYSEKGKHFSGTNIGLNLLSVDLHELGHLLMNDAGHRYTFENIMGDKARKRFDRDQCKLIYSYYERENKRFEAVLSGMSQVCKIANELGVDSPAYCSQ